MKPRHPLQTKARELRNDPTDVERHLWRHLKNRQLQGIKFRRQQPIEGYIVDFVSFAPKIVIELDGGQHALATERDAARDACLRANGFTVLRFWNNEVLNNLEGVLTVIRQHCQSPPPKIPPALDGRGPGGG